MFCVYRGLSLLLLILIEKSKKLAQRVQLKAAPQNTLSNNLSILINKTGPMTLVSLDLLIPVEAHTVREKSI